MKKTEVEQLTATENFWIGLMFFILVNAIGYHITAFICWDEKWIMTLNKWDNLERTPLIMSIVIVNIIFIGYWGLSGTDEEE